MSAIIQIKNVSKTFGSNVLAVDSVSLDIFEGEFVTLLGPSGCGKTTILRMVAGFETPDIGEIFLSGDDVTDVPPYDRNLNMVFQDFALFPHMTVYQNVSYGLKVMGIRGKSAEKSVVDALSMVELSDEVDRKPHELSGGQRQRAALARALVRKPRVLLLDEPLASLDANLRASLRIELKQLHEKLGITFLMVTHDQTEALVMADRVVLMNDGNIVQQGTPNEIYEQPSSTYVANFIGSTNLLQGKVTTKTDIGYTVLIGSSEVQVVNTGDFNVGEDINLCIRPEKAFITSASSVNEKRNSLPATVDEILYHGNTVRLRACLETKEMFLMDVQLTELGTQQSLPSKGDTICISFNHESSIVFPWEDLQ